MENRKLPCTVLLVLVVSVAAIRGPATARDIEQDDPTALGFSEERLDRIDAAFERYIDEGALPGAVILVRRHGKVAHLGVYGWQDLDAKIPMTDKSIFRIASQTKSIVSVGIMILQEEGKLLIEDTVDAYLPEFAETSVAEVGPAGGYSIVPASRRITIRDLLTHTAGIGYGRGLASEEWAAEGLSGWYLSHREEPIRETVRRMASLPFEAHPGERYVYGYSTDVLGAVIEIASGQALDEFLSDRIFEPLGMNDTHFYLPEEKADRLATVYAKRKGEPLQRVPDESSMDGQGGYVEGPRICFSGGAGLVSTAGDYGRYLQMLLNGGQLDGRRVLSRKSVELMTVNHLDKGIRFPRADGVGIGLGFRIVEDVGRFGRMSSIGEYGWGGAYHSTYWVNPEEDLLVVYFTQVRPAEGVDDHGKLRALVYQACEI